VGHSSSNVTETVYRHQSRPVITVGAEAMECPVRSRTGGVRGLACFLACCGARRWPVEVACLTHVVENDAGSALGETRGNGLADAKLGAKGRVEIVREGAAPRRLALAGARQPAPLRQSVVT